VFWRAGRMGDGVYLLDKVYISYTYIFDSLYCVLEGIVGCILIKILAFQGLD
jgi:hypothetical protein